MRVAFRSPGENLDAGVSVDHVRFDLDPTCGARIGGKVAEFLEYKRVEAGGLGVAVCIFCEEIAGSRDVREREKGAPHQVGLDRGRRQNMEQDQPGALTCGNLTSKRRARARGLSKCGGKQHDAFASACIHREMSLGSHGNDREVDRAQHLFCHGTEEQLTQLAPAPGSQEHAAGLELPGYGSNLIGGIALAQKRLARDVQPARQVADWLQFASPMLQCAGGIVDRHSRQVGGIRCGRRHYMEKNQARSGLSGLLQGERGQPIKVTQIGGYEQDGWMDPAGHVCGRFGFRFRAWSSIGAGSRS